MDEIAATTDTPGGMEPTIDRPPRASIRLKALFRRRGVVSALATVLVIGALAVVYMGDAALECSSTVRGAPGDGTSGAVWLNWAWQENGGGPFDSTQTLTGAGRDDSLWQPVMIINSGWSLPMYAISQVAGPVCGYNLTIMLGYVTTGLGMWALVFALTRSRLVSLFAAVVFAFSGFAQMKSEGHISGVYLGLFPLLILCLIRLWRAPNWRNVLLAAVPWAGLAYVDAYYLPFSLVLVSGFTVGAMASMYWERSTARVLIGRLAHICVAGVAALVLLLPFAIVTLSNKSSISAERGRSLSAAIAYSARPLEYVVPPYSHPLFVDFLTDWKFENIHGSNPTESTLYLGWVPLLLAAVAVVIVGFRRRRCAVDRQVTDSQLLVICALIGVVLVGFVSSLSPTFEIFGQGVVMPSRVIRKVFPEMRVFARMFVVVSSGVVALAAVGLAQLLQKVDRLQRSIIVGSLIVLGLFESLTGPVMSPPVWAYSQTPEVYQYIADDDTVSMVARYPLDTPRDDPDKQIFSFQPVLEKVLVNPIDDTASAVDPGDIARGIASLADPQTIPVLRALGADVVVVQTQSLGESDSAVYSTLGLALDRKFRYAIDDAPNQINGGADRWAYLSPLFDTDLFRVADGPVAPAAVALGGGWFAFERIGWGGQRWMDGAGEVTAVGLNGTAGTVEVSFDVIGFGMDREIDIVAGDVVLDSFVASTEQNRVSFVLPVDTTVHLEPVTPPTPVPDLVPGSSDTRALSILVSNIGVTDA